MSRDAAAPSGPRAPAAAGGVELETTPDCAATLRVLLAAEELGLAVALKPRENGYFRREYGSAGPRWVERGEGHLGFAAILARLREADVDRRLQSEGTERWCAWYLSCLLPAVQAVSAAPDAGRSPGPALGALLTRVAELEVHLAGATWLGAEFGLADCAVLAVAELFRRFPDGVGGGPTPAARFPAVKAWVERVEARPSLGRARARVREAFMRQAG